MGRKKGKSVVSKKDKKRLYSLVDSVDWSDEDSVFNLGVELGRYSVFLRSRVLELNEEF